MVDGRAPGRDRSAAPRVFLIQPFAGSCVLPSCRSQNRTAQVGRQPARDERDRAGVERHLSRGAEDPVAASRVIGAR